MMRWLGGILGRGCAPLLLCVSLFPFAAGCGEPGLIEHEPVSAAIGFFNDAGGRRETAEALAAQLSARSVDVTASLAKSGDGKNPFVRWLPGGAAPSVALPLRPPDARWGYSFERGPLHLTVIETEEPMPENSAAYLWLMDDLSLSSKPWKVVLMRRPIFSFGPTRVDRARVDVADLLSREGVTLVLSPGEGGYCRSARIGTSLRESVHYVSLEWKEQSPDNPDWVARAVGEPCCCVLEAGKIRFRWSVFDAQGRLVDLLEFSPGAPAAQEAKAFTESEVKIFTESEAKVFTVSEVLAGERAQEAGAGDEKK